MHMTTRDSHVEFIARGLLIRAGRVLLCRNIAKDYLYLPGGHVEFGEPAAAALEREFLEETGRVVRAGHCLLVSEHAFKQGKKHRHEINLVFHVEHVEPEKGLSKTDKKRGEKGKTLKKKGSSSRQSRGVFHVEHPDLPRFRSLEKDIAFDWIDLAGVVDMDLRPAMVKAWLCSGGAIEPTPRPASLPPMGWYSDIPNYPDASKG